MNVWKQGLAVACLGAGLVATGAHAQEAEDFVGLAQTEEPATPLAQATSEDYAVQSFNGRSVLPVKVRNCWYYAYVRPPPYNPYLPPWNSGPPSLVVERLPIGGCQGQARVLTYAGLGSILALSAAGDELVLAHAQKDGWGRWGYWLPLDLKVLHVRTDTLENRRTVNNTLSVVNYWGRVDATFLEMAGQDLVVHGTKTGPILTGQPEQGAGRYFKATFKDFLRGTEAPAIEASETPTTHGGDEGLEARDLDPVDYESPFTAFSASFMPPFQVRNCWYVMHRRWMPYMSPNNLYVDRLPTTGCAAGRTYVGYTWGGNFMVAVKQGQLALAWGFVSNPYWPSYSVQLAQLDAQTFTHGRTEYTQLSAGSAPGNRFSAQQMYFDGSSLVLKGTKTGPVTEVRESGSGSNFTATYERFLNSEAPPTVEAW